jgi:pimeloyl-ACP methyl ester carboxylesterase
VTAPVSYARSGDVNIAYQVTGEGQLDLVLVPGFFSHLEIDWEHPEHARFLERLASFSRLIRFDKRGTGLSDRAVGLADFETRMDDVRAVMDAAGSEQAALFGYSEGGPMCVLFAAAYPERARALVLYGTYAKRTRSDDYPWAPTWEERVAAAHELEETWGENVDLSTMIPGADPATASWFQRRGRAALSPSAARDLILMNSKADVREALPAVQCPTLVLHRVGDHDSRVDEGRFIASRIPGARFVELTGDEHVPFVRMEEILVEVEEFLTGVRPVEVGRRVLATILFTTSWARPYVPASSETRCGPRFSNVITTLSGASSPSTAARRWIPRATASSRSSTGPHGRFAAGWPCARRCARSGWTSGSVCIPERSSEPTSVRAGSRSTSLPGSWRPRAPARCSSPRRRAISWRALGSSSPTEASSS